MNWILSMYALLLRLYPRGFREAYGEEMQAVYADSLHEARRSGALALGAFARMRQRSRSLPNRA